METSTLGSGIVRRGARVAHAFVRTQVLAGYAPFFVLRRRLAALPGCAERAEDPPSGSVSRTPVTPSPLRQR